MHVGQNMWANMLCSCQCMWVDTCGLTCCQMVRGSCPWDVAWRGEVVMHVGPNMCAYMLCICQCLQLLLTNTDFARVGSAARVQ